MPPTSAASGAGRPDARASRSSTTACCYQVTSPPAIVNGLVVVGSSIGDNRAADLERGVVRAYDARTGALRWSWDPIPTRESDPARATWAGDSWRRTGAANVWSVMSVDAERGLVFLPTSSPSPDFYGGERLGANRLRELGGRAARGDRRGRLALPGRAPRPLGLRRARAARPRHRHPRRRSRSPPSSSPPRWATSSSCIATPARRCSRSRSGPSRESTVPGEEASPTQPFPSARARWCPRASPRTTRGGSTPEERESCRARIARLRSEGIFTPPSLEGTVVFPGLRRRHALGQRLVTIRCVGC